MILDIIIIVLLSIGIGTWFYYLIMDYLEEQHKQKYYSAIKKGDLMVKTIKSPFNPDEEELITIVDIEKINDIWHFYVEAKNFGFVGYKTISNEEILHYKKIGTTTVKDNGTLFTLPTRETIDKVISAYHNVKFECTDEVYRQIIESIRQNSRHSVG